MAGSGWLGGGGIPEGVQEGQQSFCTSKSVEGMVWMMHTPFPVPCEEVAQICWVKVGLGGVCGVYDFLGSFRS